MTNSVLLHLIKDVPVDAIDVSTDGHLMIFINAERLWS